MKKKIFIILILYILNSPTFCSFVETIYSAENLRLGGSVAKDYSSDAVFINPAILSYNLVPEVFLTYNSLYPNLTDATKFVNNTVAFTQKLLGVGVGVGFNQFGVVDWYLRNRFVLSYGFNFKNLLPKLNLGLKINYDQETFSLDEYMKQNPVFSKTNNNSYINLSFSGIYEVGNYNKIGATIENINILKNGFSEDINPFIFNFSYKYQYKKLNIYPTVSFEFSQITNHIGTISFEYNFVFFKKFKFSPSLTVSYGTSGYDKFIFGFDIQTSQIKISYGNFISISSKINTGFSQCISLSYKFLPQPLEEEKVSKVEYEKLLKEKQQLEQELDQLRATKQPEQPPETKPQQPTTTSTEELLLKKIQELEEKLKSKELKPTEEKPKSQLQQQPTTQPATKPQETKKRYHTVVAGDTLPKLAEKYYGDSSQWRKIYEANKDKIIRGQLVPGSILEIP